MSDEKDLGRELLKENGIEPGSLPEDRRKELRAMMERDKVRARGAKLGLLFGCVFGSLFVLVIRIVRGGLASDGGLVDVLFPVFVGFVFLIPFIVVSLWAIGMYFGQRKMQTTLADIAAQLEGLAKNQQADAQE